MAGVCVWLKVMAPGVGVPTTTSDCEAALESFTELMVSVPAYLSANDGSMVVWRTTLATVRLSVMPTLVVEFTAPTVCDFMPDITKPPERLAAVDTSAKVPL